MHRPNYPTGVLTCPGIFPTTFTILWRKQSEAAVIIAPLLGMATGLGVWLGTAASYYGEVTVKSTGMIVPCLCGTVASAISPALYSIVISLIKPANYDWADFQKQRLAFDQDTASVDSSSITDEPLNTSDPEYNAQLKYWARIAAYWAIATFFGHWVLWPLPMYASKYIFGKEVSFLIL
jgi:hypothetical protein